MVRVAVKGNGNRAGTNYLRDKLPFGGIANLNQSKKQTDMK